MPVYVYRCENCGVQFDRFQKFTDPPLTRCPECGKKALHKVYTPVGIVFKGSGFYATDHRSPSGGATSHSSANGKESEKPAAEASKEKPSTSAEKKASPGE